MAQLGIKSNSAESIGIGPTDFCFCYAPHRDCPMEDWLEEVAENLRKLNWQVPQKADLIVVGETGHHHYILNKASEEARQRLAEEYGGRELEYCDVSRKRLWRVTVRNMVTIGHEPVVTDDQIEGDGVTQDYCKLSPTYATGRDAVILEAYVGDNNTTHGYCRLYPTYANFCTMELDALISTLMELKMLKISRYPALKRLRAACKQIRA